MTRLRILLAPFALVYGVGVLVRNWLFDFGLLPTTRVDIPVVSVGNVSTGGTGKTPLVEFLARDLRARGKKVAVISRGYQRSTSGYVVVSNGVQRCAEASASGDEPSQMAEKLDGVVVVVDEQRVRAARRVIKEFKPNIILLDDGFQHRYLHRDLNIAVVSSDEMLSPSWLLPAGNKREPVSSLRRADVVVVSRCADLEMFSAISNRLAGRTSAPIVGMNIRPVSLKHAATSAVTDLQSISGKRVVAFSGIGNPGQFEQTVESLSAVLVKHHRFPDHHQYSASELETIQQTFSTQKADFILTTEKDVARLRGNSDFFLKQKPLYYIDVRAEMLWGMEAFNVVFNKLG